MSRLHRWTSHVVTVALLVTTVPTAAAQMAGASQSSSRHELGTPTWKPTPAPKPKPFAWKTPAAHGTKSVKNDPKAKRVKELTGKRTADSSVWQMSDGSTQQEVSLGPVHYKDAKGNWQNIDSTIKPVKHDGGYTVGAEADSFRTYFSPNAGSLVRLEQGSGAIQIGADGATSSAPKVNGATVSYPGAWSGADLNYAVGPGGLKESIVLAKAPGASASYSFTVTLAGGLTPKQNADGSIAIYGSESGNPSWTIPAPYMSDSKDDKNSPYGKVFSAKVEQSMSFDAKTGTLHLTETPDAAWLADGARQYPVTVDPTIMVSPNNTNAANVMISADGPTSNYDTSWRLSVGTTATGAARALVKFPMPSVPAGTTITSADLKVYYDQTFTTGVNNVPMQALQANAAWSPTTATWNNASSIAGPVAGATQMTANALAVWDDFPVTSAVQNWISGTAANNGFVLKATNETPLGQGGPRFEGSIFAYNGEVVNYPKLVITYGIPGVTVNAPTVIHSTGAELSWPAYTNTTGNSANDLAEYQVHRSISQIFTPSASTEVSPVDSSQTSFVDSTAVPTPANNSDPYGNAYYYMVAVKTKAGDIITGPTQLVRLPEAGRTTLLIPSVAATTLSSTLPTTVLNTLSNAGTPEPWLEVGDNSGTYGITRSAFDFGQLSQVPANSQILDAHLKLWQETTSTNTSGAVYELHGLTRSFVGNQATWNTAATGTAWTTVGGDFNATADGTLSGVTNDPNRQNFDATSIVQGWINTAGSDHGLLVKQAVETGSKAPQERAIFAGPSTAEPALAPTLVVTYLDSSTGDTYYAPSTPSDMVPGTTYTTPVTINNTTSTTWAAASEVLTYHWTLPDGTDVTGTSQLQTALPSGLAPGATVTLNAQVTPPPPTDGNQAEGATLAWDMYDKTTGVYLSAGAPAAAPPVRSSKIVSPRNAGDASLASGTTGGIGSLKQQVSVDPSGNNQLGLETFYPYSTTATGSGTNLYTNEASGNTVWNYDLFSHPSLGFNTFLRLSYNSMSTMDTTTGFGWTVQASAPMRLGQGLQFQPPGNPTSVVMVDGTGNAHLWTLNPDNTWKSPPGVHLYLQKSPAATCGPQTNDARAWKMTRPDRTTYWFDCEGFPTSQVDANGNEADFTYSVRQSQNKPEEFLSYITDPAPSGRRKTLTLSYFNRGDASYQYVDSTGAVQTGTNLTDPAIIDHVKSISDVSGRTVNFIYTGNGELAQLVDGANDPNVAKTFKFTYDATQGMKNVKLVSVQDPIGSATPDPTKNVTQIKYYSTSSATKWWTSSVTDRDKQATSFAYVQPSPVSGAATQTTVTDANTHSEVIQTNAYGQETQSVDPLQHKTTLTWDADNNVSSLTEDNGATTKWTYDSNTGYPLSEQDAVAVVNSAAATTYTYQTTDSADTTLSGHIADLTDMTSPLGHRWHYTYDGNGNRLTATAPDGNVTNPAFPYTSNYTYDSFGERLTATDADGHITAYGYETYPSGGSGTGAYEPTGQPVVVTDANNKSTNFVYAARGEVIQTTDPLNHVSTQNYDVFDRPTDGKVPKDQASGSYVVTPAPVYDANDNVTSSTAPFITNYPVANSTITTTYDPDDRPLTKDLPANNSTATRQVVYGYDNVGNQVSATEPLGNATAGTYTSKTYYDADNQPAYTLDGAGHKTQYAFNDVGDRTAVTDPNNNETQFLFDADHRLTLTTDASTFNTAVEYDADGRKINATDQNGRKTAYTLDPDGQVVRVDVPRTVDGNGAATSYDTVAYTYDQVGNNLTVVSPRGVANNDGSYTTSTQYDNDNRKLKVLGAYATSISNDPNYAQYNQSQQPETDYTYDDAGRVSSVDRITQPNQYMRIPDGQTAASAEHAVSNFSYFDNGWTKSSADPFKITTSYDYNGLGEQNLRVISSADANLPGGTSASGAAQRQMDWLYYPDGSLQNFTDTGVPAGWEDQVVTASSSQTGPPNSNWAASGAGAGYDGSQYYTGSNSTVPFTWQLTIPEDGNYQIYVYYPSGGTVANYQVTYNGGADTTPPVGQTGFLHVDQSQNAGTWVALGTPLQFKAGTDNQQVQLFPAGAPVNADAIRVVRTDSVAQPASKNMTYTYDVDGNLTDLSDTSPGATQVNDYKPTYNADLDQLKQVQEDLSGAVVHTLNWGYDNDGNVTSWSQDSTGGTYQYTALNQLKQVTDTQGTSPAVNTSYTYTRTGQLNTETKNNGNIVTDTYNADNTLSDQREVNSQGSGVGEHTLSYDANNNVQYDALTLASANNGTPLTRTSTYAYSPNNQVTSVGNSDNKDNQTYQYDSSGNVIQEGIQQSTGMGTLGFVYDRGRMYRTQNPDASGGVYQYDTLGRLHNVSNGTFSGTVTGVGQSYTYDGFDNVLTQSATKSSGIDTTDYTYDSLDRPITESIDPGATGAQRETIDYLGSGRTVADETIATSSVGDQKVYDYAPSGERLAMVDTTSTTSNSNSQTSYYSYNQRGDVEALTDPNGATTNTYGYTAYGNPETDLESGSDAGSDNAAAFPYNAFRYNSAKVNTTTDNYDMGFRQYDPNINRFISRDSYNGSGADAGLAADPGNGNRYGFAGGNPISNVEVNGHDWKSALGVGLTIAGVAGAIACTVLTEGGCLPVLASEFAAGAEVGGAEGAVASGLGAGIIRGAAAIGERLGIGGSAATLGIAGAAGGAGAAIEEDLSGSAGADAAVSEDAAAGGGNGGGCTTKVGGESFSPDTRVQLADGSTKAISDLKPGDKVKSTDTATGKTKESTTSAVLVKHDTDLYDLTVHTAKGDKVINTTQHHLFFDKTRKKWVEAGDLPKGDELTTNDGTVATVVGGLTPAKADGDMWDLTVPGDHDFYVEAGDTAVLVHNICLQGAINQADEELAGRYQTTGRIFDRDGNSLGVDEFNGDVSQITSGDRNGWLRQLTRRFLGYMHGQGVFAPEVESANVNSFLSDDHVEAKYAAWMRLRGIKSASVYINNPNGVCEGAQSCAGAMDVLGSVAAILPRGWTMDVYYPGRTDVSDPFTITGEGPDPIG